MAVDFQVRGLDGVLKRMRELAPKLQKKGLDAATRRGANVIKKAAIIGAKQIDDPATAASIAKNIVVRKSTKTSKKVGGSAMRVGVLGGARAPATASGEVKGKGKGNPGGDTYYWRFHEFGTENIAARPFMRPALAENTTRATDEVVAELNRQLDKLTNAPRVI